MLFSSVVLDHAVRWTIDADGDERDETSDESKVQYIPHATATLIELLKVDQK